MYGSVCMVCMYGRYGMYGRYDVCMVRMYGTYVWYVCMLRMYVTYVCYACMLCMYGMYVWYVCYVRTVRTQVGRQVYIKNCGFLTPTKNIKPQELRSTKSQTKIKFKQFQLEDDPALPIPSPA